jgi:hypothetical protein
MPQSKEILTKDYWNNAAYSFATDKVSNGAIFESIQSQLPGRSNGPADAYRHLLLAAEMTRKMGGKNAKHLLDLHEWTGNQDGQTKQSHHMDMANNKIGILIGQHAKSWEEVVILCRQAITNKSYAGQAVTWLQTNQWDKNPIDNLGQRMSNDDPRLNWPPKWPLNNKPYPGNSYTAEPNSSISQHTTPVEIIHAENNQPYIKFNDIVSANLQENDLIYQKIHNFLSADKDFLALSQQEQKEEIKLFIEDGNQMYQASLNQQTPNKFGISPSLKAQLNEEMQQKNQQSQGRSLG